MAHSVLKRTYSQYKQFVAGNIELVGEIETALKLMSYFVAGNGSQIAPVLSELMYSLSNIMAIFHDNIIMQALRSTSAIKLPGKYLKMTLNLVDYLEVFAEVTSSKLWGSRGRWMVIIIIQALKTVLRLFLLLCNKSGLLLSPPILPMTTQQRRAAQRDINNQKLNVDTVPAPNEEPEKLSTSKSGVTFTLTRSGRTIRSLSSATPVLGRTWKPPAQQSQATSIGSHLNTRHHFPPTPLESKQLLAEVFHAIRPLAHLIAMKAFGTQSWFPWLFSCGLDITSLKLMKERRQWNEVEQTELRFRTAAIMYYVLRSPFYDRFTKEKAMKILSTLARIPVVKLVCSPMADYLPVWQRTYFYCWGN